MDPKRACGSTDAIRQCARSQLYYTFSIDRAAIEYDNDKDAEFDQDQKENFR